MQYRRFGRTELSMPVFSCGGMRYQFKWQDVSPQDIPAENQNNLEATIHRAFELGIHHIETARGYGSSEMQLGRVLPRLPRAKLIVQTKIAPEANPAEFRRHFETSLRYLGLDHVDLLAIHGINHRQHLDWTLRPGGCLDAARQIQREGRARFLGFSTHAATDVILDAIRPGEFDYVNLHWYFVNESNWPAILAARAHDMGVFIISPNDKGGKLYEPPARLRELCLPLSPMQFNDLFCLARPEVHTLSLGAARPTDFDEHVQALDHYDQGAAVAGPIADRLRAEMHRRLGADWCARWAEGLPGFEQVPGQVNLREILRLWTFGRGLDLTAWARMRYNLLGQGGHWFPGANAAHAAQLDFRACLQSHPFAARVPALLQEAHDLFAGEARQRLSQE